MQSAIVLLLTVAALGAHAQFQPQRPRPGRIAGGTVATAPDDLHAVMLLVQRADIGDDQAAMGGGSIVSRSRVLTAAHVVNGATSVQVGYFAGALQANRFRRVDATYTQPIRSFVLETFANDVAVLQFATDIFPRLNVIQIAAAAPADAAAARLVAFGFTAPNSQVPSQIPNASAQVVAACTEVVKATPSHFCALAQQTSVVCGGDNGAGLFTGTGEARRLVGVVSLLQPGCAGAARLTAYASLSGDAVRAFLRSQNVPLETPATV